MVLNVVVVVVIIRKWYTQAKKVEEISQLADNRGRVMSLDCVSSSKSFAWCSQQESGVVEEKR